MQEVRTILLSKSVFEDNDRAADALRERLREKGVCLVNVMSSPGSGKTTLLVSLIRRLAEKYRVGVMEADIDSDVDAVTVARETGCRSVQLHTDGMCHLDAGMTEQGLRELGEGLDLIFLENVGNLVCPAEYDTGATCNVVILSVPEGTDKPLKYPLVFENSDLVIISKIDALPYFDFDIEECKSYVGKRNGAVEVIPVSAKTGENMEALENWFINKVTGV
ncbi:hydrogenase nickel incorporation protein HypB [uncultured Ruminococcus sp.]|uniref:hydrogenase nickel incorporation protein HypB n=1 Tax=uncultured Ruminococcus sp. TaxID=165186 RepID=UPI00292EBC42|nr:hydrogenase nickel incorporation protein HypB [uncultured Ruminococcus sp.]